MNLLDIKSTFPSEKECREYLAKLRWKNGFICPNCKGKDAYVTSELKYKCKKCKHKISITSGTLFQDTHVPLTKWFMAIVLYIEHGQALSPDILQKKLELGSIRTASRMKSLIEYASKKPRIATINDEIEIREYDVNSSMKKIWVLFAEEIIDTTRRVHIFKINTKQRQQIKALLEEGTIDIFDSRKRTQENIAFIHYHLVIMEEKSDLYNRILTDIENNINILKVFPKAKKIAYTLDELTQTIDQQIHALGKTFEEIIEDALLTLNG